MRYIRAIDRLRPYRLAALLCSSSLIGAACAKDDPLPPPPADLAVPDDLTVPPDEAQPVPDFTLLPVDFAWRGADLTALPDLAASGDFAGQEFPAPHPSPPQGQSNGGRVLSTPHLVSVTFAGDKLAASLDAFAAALPAADWWPATMAEYGIGAGVTLPPIHLAETPPRKLDDSDIAAWLADKLDGTHPEFATPPDPDALYLLYYPANTSITLSGSTSCQAFGGYHQSTRLHDGTRVAYAVMPRCGIGAGGTLFDGLTAVASHEVVEAATDPDPSGKTAYASVDTANRGFAILAGGAELADLCEFMQDVNYKSAFNFMLQRSWSNASAKAGHDPCVPAPSGRAYFNAAPVLTDTIHLGGNGNGFPGMRIAPGGSATIELALFSDEPTQPFTVSATTDRTTFAQTAQRLSFSFDRDTGVNGSRIKLTVKVDRAGPNNHEGFAIESTLGPYTNRWFVMISDK